MSIITRTLAVVLATAALASAAQEAKPWPQKAVRIIIPTPVGAPVDIIVRQIQPKLQTLWGQPVAVENRPEGGIITALQEVARATDGHTFLAGPDIMVTVTPHLYRNLGVDPAKALVPVTYMASFNQMLVCNPRAGFGNLGALLKAARKSQMNYASSGTGTPSHMAMEMLLSTTWTKMQHVPYRGPSPAAQDVVAGKVQCGFLASSVVLPFVKDGRLQALAVSGGIRSPQAPTVPTVAEDTVVGFDATFFETLQAPAGMPAAVVRKVRDDVAQLLVTPEVSARLRDYDLTVVANTSAEAAKRSAADTVKWGRIAKMMKLSLD